MIIKRWKVLSLLLIMFLVSSLLQAYMVKAEASMPTLSLKIHRILKVDDIEGWLEGEADWHYYIYVWNGEEWCSVDDVAESNRDDVIVDATYTFEVKVVSVTIIIVLLEDDTATASDVADISSYSGGGYDNYNGTLPRGAKYVGTYNLKTNELTGDEIITEGEYFKTSGDYDDSIDVDENDASLWFKVWDNYEAPVADAGPDQTVYTNEKVNFDGSGSTASDGSSIVKYEWDFDGDGVIDAEGQKTSYTYTKKGVYTVTLKVTDSLGETSQDTCIITVLNRGPSASFTYSPTNPSIEDTISFYDTSTDPDGTIVSWFWEFGDGSNSTERNPTHQYTDKGQYIVKLTVTDNDGGTDTVEQTITIRNLPPIASFTYSPHNPMAGQEISFTDTSTDPEGREISYWHWDFGDGYTSNLKNPKHTYENPGSYTVTLTVKDDEGLESTYSIVIDVRPNYTMYYIIGGLLAAAVGALIALKFIRGRKMPPPPPSAQTKT